MEYAKVADMADDELIERIESLRDEVANEHVEELLDIMEAVHVESIAARDAVSGIRTRVSRVEDFTGVGLDEDVQDLMSPKFDSRDAAVLRTLKGRNPETVSVAQIQEIYIQRTDVRDSVTLRSRVKELVDRGPFSSEGGTIWRFTAYRPPGDDAAAEA